MTITARYAATCPCCAAPIRPGDQIEWSKGSPARHAGCKPSATPSFMVATPAPRTSSPRPRTTGKWTGCSCGSRVDSYGDLIPSPRNCFSCNHDA